MGYHMDLWRNSYAGACKTSLSWCKSSQILQALMAERYTQRFQKPYNSRFESW